jgi:hypothetical protein
VEKELIDGLIYHRGNPSNVLLFLATLALSPNRKRIMKKFNVRPEPVAMEEIKYGEEYGNKAVGMIVYATDCGEAIIKIATDDRTLGINSEYVIVKEVFPGYEVKGQSVSVISVNRVNTLCDILTIANETEEKQIYFDISDFFYTSTEHFYYGQWRVGGWLWRRIKWGLWIIVGLFCLGVFLQLIEGCNQ